MVTLVCALAIDLGHPFVIDLLETCILEDLRLAVAQRNPDVIKCPLRKLELFCAQRDGKWPTTAETRELDPEALDLERLDYPLFRLDHAGFGDRDVSANTHVVHVVRVSKNHELQHASEPTMTLADVEERFESAVKNVTNSYADKQSVYGFSECTYSKEEEFIEKLGLSTKMLEVKEELEFSVKGCNWEESDHYCQRVRYLAYMDEHLKDALFPNDRWAEEYRIVFGELRLVIEHWIVSRYQQQLLMELIVADFESGDGQAPMGHLTDLNNA
ncbi:neutral zinc metallopeptidase [Phytophthora sojae]|uniref:Neutral zinc metallopeptidase n=1 Tax=Phytophthora sojae (strain P6497) TaxID=1094619 RepID=G4YQZ6_PHYSP|nr:neutral zinc metallopeptidase [Phytophthora sojae]EGZ30624.1 neutral zinc metallopeptidase [Phytophthora sojae]|eukprot:XP_009517899.1 neutral zinc metallopeptidase [Phytophthora sojae]